MTAEPRAFLAIDHGAASTAVACIGHIGGSWRLLGDLTVAASADVDRAVAVLIERIAAVDPRIAAAAGLVATTGVADAADLPRVEARSRRPGRLAIVAGSDRALAALTASAARSGWRISGASVQSTDPLTMTRLLVDRSVDAILAGADDPPGADERGALRELAALVAAVARREPGRPIILAGAMSDGLSAFGDLDGRPGGVILAPAARADDGWALVRLLTEAALPPDDGRRAVAHATQSLADILDRRVETIVLGHDASVRVIAGPSGGGPDVAPRTAIVPTAAIAPDEPDDSVVDGVAVWMTVAADRHRIRDRMRELRIAPCADATGDGAALRMAAARAALARLDVATSAIAGVAPPDLIVTASGAWTGVPAPAVALAIVDVVRRPGASQIALDHARLLGPLGTIGDPQERRAVLADLLDDLLVPLGTVVTPAGLRAGRSAGTLQVHGTSGDGTLDLIPGGLELVDLPPGEAATAEFRFRDAVRLGARGRHFAIDVTGGLGGLLVDLRDVPLRLPERADRRRDLLAAWQGALWSDAEDRR
ncbi:MAG: hypothetical protein ACLGIJ_01645 [Candidatus Limnocylindria bacterium]